MSATELQTWWAFYQLEPWGDLRGDLRMGIQTSALVNCWTGKGRTTQPADFLPDFYKPGFTPRARQTPQQMLALARQATVAAGGRIIRP